MGNRAPQLVNLSPVHDKWEWQYKGACKSMDTEIFFLEDRVRGSEKQKREREALKICNKCPVIQECLKHALSVPEMYGVWGGTTADQRWAMLRRSKVH
jgi:WhiB family redox-sensing transcriptional regulator